MRVFVGTNVLLRSGTIVSLAQAFDLTLQGIETARNVPAHVLDDAGARGHLRAVQRAIPPVPGRDAALRGEEIGAARILVAPDHRLLESGGRAGRHDEEGNAVPSDRPVHGKTSSIEPHLRGQSRRGRPVPWALCGKVASTRGSGALAATFRQFDFPSGLEDIT